ncbi:ATP-dependent Clp protease proteolytic subunit [Paracoccus sp. R86501]|uniref:ATP-dependent Clp protease proteolytic subunit n=1 Tax=Paracoccus sp. R86501 TaxID=3101711 RepID=UPI00366F6F28
MRHQWLDDDDDHEEDDDRQSKGDKDGGLGLPEGDKIGKLYFKSRTVIVAGAINDKLAQRTVAHLLALAEDSDEPINMLISFSGWSRGIGRHDP